MTITPDTKDWTWVLRERCPECGFDAFAVSDDGDVGTLLSGFDDFAGVYASTARARQPWFRRRPSGAGSALS